MELLYRRFVKVWLLATIAALLAVALINILVDPAGAYPRWHLATFQPLRYLIHDRVHKAEMASQGAWEVLILGSSRAKAGFPADHPFLATNRTCNLSLDGVKFPELVSVFQYARQHNRLKHVILCLDLYMFAPGPRWAEDYLDSRFNSDLDPFKYYAKQLLGRAASGDTWDTLRQKFKHYVPPPQVQNGFYQTSLGPGTSQRDLFGRVLRIMGSGYRRQTVDLSFMDLFREIVRTCRDQHIDLQVVIMPVHALDLELLYASGRWPEFEKWKTDLVSMLAQEGVEGQFGLWDFTAYAGPPAEAIPAAGDVTSRMKYYFENSHCTPTVGGMMLDTILGDAGTNTFGLRLNRTNLQAHLAQILTDRAYYAQTNAAEIRWVQQILAQAAAGRN
jgi:hypothetical protein